MIQIAHFTKVFVLAGGNRTLKISYLKDGNVLASKDTNVLVNKGTPKIKLATDSKTKTITNNVKLTTSVSGLAFAKHKGIVRVKFYNNAQLQDNVKVPIKIKGSQGKCLLDYTFKKSYSNMTIITTFNGGSNYYSVSDSVNVVVNKV